jgi:hypothetical protein
MPKSQTDRHPDDLETEDVQRPDGEIYWPIGIEGRIWSML